MKTGKLILRILLCLVAAAALVLGTYFITLGSLKPAEPETYPEETQIPEPVTTVDTSDDEPEKQSIAKSVILSFHDASGETITLEGKTGQSLELPEAIAFEGYNFIGWTDENGEILPGNSVIPHGDGEFNPLYIVALDTVNHKPYIFPDSAGIYHVYEELSRAEAVQMLANLLAVDVESTGNFSDVSADAEYAEAASKIYQLQVIKGDKLRPGDSITRAEFIEMLAAFYPRSGEKFEFADVAESDAEYSSFCTAAELGWIESGKNVKLQPDEFLTKLDAIKLINRVLGRGEGLEIEERMEGLSPDLAFDDPDYAQLLEAGFEHSYELAGGNESWTYYDWIIPVQPGMYVSGHSAYCVGEDGLLVRGETVGEITFDELGRVTSGMPELDELVDERLRMLIRDEDDTPLQKLRIAYDYITHCFSYRKGHVQADADVSWSNELAYQFFTTGKGNCYAFSAGFAALARALGYDAVVQPGCVGEDKAPHCWVTINIDGGEYIFDPELENARLTMNNELHDMFMMTETFVEFWKYQPYGVK